MILPCIDLQDGKAVQLIQGRSLALTVDDIDGLLERFSPFPLIHVIDLDEAMGRGSNAEIVARIVRQRPARVGGGVRTLDKAVSLVEAGAVEVIVGTAAFSGGSVNVEFLGGLASSVGASRIVVALDCLQSNIVVRGWTEKVPLKPAEALKPLEPYCSGFLCTYVDAEGTMKGTDIELYRTLRSITEHRIIAAGGIGKIQEVRELADVGVDVALGMSIYTGAISLEALVSL